MNRRLLLIVLVLVAMLATGCGNNTPQTIEVTRIVPETVIVEVTRIVERIVTATPKPGVPTPLPTPTPESVISLEIGSYSHSFDSGSLQFVGEILNRSKIAVSDVDIAISLLDKDGNTLAAHSTNIAERRVVPPDGKFPYLILFTNDPPKEWADVRIQVQGKPYDDTGYRAAYVDLRIEGTTGAPPASISGRIVNTGKSTAESVQVIGVAYDAAGTVVDVSFAYSELDKIPPGDSAPFTIDWESNVKSASFELFVDGRISSEESPQNSTIAQPTPVPTSPFVDNGATGETVLSAFRDAGLEAERSFRMQPTDYGLVPQVCEAWRFFIPSIGSDNGGRVFVCAKEAAKDEIMNYYEDIGKLFSFWVFSKDNIVVQINGELPEATARKYEQAIP